MNNDSNNNAAPAPAADTTFPAAWQPALDHSAYLRQLLSCRGELVPILAESWQRPLTAADLEEWIAQAAPADEEALKPVLRRLRQRVMAHLIIRDLAAAAPLQEVVETMTLLADITTNFALDFVHRSLVQQYGEPLDSQGRPQRLLVVGMGKLGGRELNVSSDVDYIFVYPEEGQTAGRADGGGQVDNYDFFHRLGKRLIIALGDLTADGQVFRVDMRLRPNGDSGPLVCSLDALENYFITQGREWERYAWIKARVMNAGANDVNNWGPVLSQTGRPFVFRKYLDFGAINAMRDLHAQIRREVARKDMANHVKLGPGGIREIEFIAQVFQLIRGGRDTALQIRPTLQVLALLPERGLMAQEAVDELSTAYDFLRRLEHRLQYVADQQTHSLPEDAEGQARIARSMGFADYPALLAVLDGHRQRVSLHFEAVFAEPEAPSSQSETLTALWQGALECDGAQEKFAGLGFADVQDSLERLQAFRDGARYQQLPASNRERMDALGPRLIEAAAATPTPDLTLSRCLAFLEAIGRRGAYLALLQQYPQALKKVAELIGGSSWAAEYLTRHPILLDELLDPRLLEVATDWQRFRRELRRALDECAGDTEREMDLLREMHHAQVFRLLAQDLAGLHSIEKISDHLTELADIMVAETVRLCWGKLKTRHREEPVFAVIGYGKLGGKELGYASDLDIIFLFDEKKDTAQEAEEVYARLAQRVNTWLSSQTPAGLLFETDLRLRPNGDSGLMVSSLASFREYQLHSAWVWEHQALTRARFVAGDADVGRGFDAIREEILRQPRDRAKLKEEVLAMRQKMIDANASDAETVARGEFDIKQDPGGIIDVEFIIQYLVLGHAHEHPELTGNLGNIALLGIAARLGLIPAALAEPVQNAYRDYRRLQHAKRLNGSPKSRVARESVAERIAAVRALWEEVFKG